ncbi:uncharacterized protein LOC115756772 [Rhodamnia argentea]|uniref:Uncharacterized protein LOC115756772 n=1 Tax=Rhodamnia argentea TaxID=178133 RepID=A0A8B8QZ90_9MYRT|nr:uncharacterized protein LOC115756772 [Rhodamnia argentea]
MSSDAQASTEQQEPNPKIQIYPTSAAGVSPFWRDKYEREAKKYWDVFYKRHQDKFFKDRHYLDKEWGQYFSGAGKKIILEVGCGAGNTIFPLVATYPEVFVHACDFSPRAVNLVKLNKDFKETQISPFVCDLTVDDLNQQIPSSSVDIVTMIFVLSAVSPEKMHLVLQNIRRVLKPKGHVLFRDYATGDLAQERLTCKDQMISENFYVRGDGTRAFYFSNEFLASLFKDNGFDVKEIGLCCKQVENRSRELVMNRRWIQAVFCPSDSEDLSSSNCVSIEVDLPSQENTESNRSSKASKDPVKNIEIDISEGVAADMFGISSSVDNEIIQVSLNEEKFSIRVLSKEYQHTCKSTGLMLWESAQLMASVLARNPNIVSGKKVLELGCGCGGICSMVAVRSADLVVATDGDKRALDLLMQNVALNIAPPFRDKLIVKSLEWGDRGHIEAIKEVNDEGFNIIIGTDVTYIPEAILPLFATARKLISPNRGDEEDQASALILCHVVRQVDEPSMLSAASRYGFRLVERWPAGISGDSSRGVVGSWFAESGIDKYSFSAALSIMYFQIE